MRTLRRIRESEYAPLFYRQTWWLNEPFANELRPGRTAAWMAERFVADPTNPKWRRFIWTDDIDSHGNRVYVGGVGEFGCDGFQIHRLLEPDERWAEWEDL